MLNDVLKTLLNDVLKTLLLVVPKISAEDVADVLWLAPFLPQRSASGLPTRHQRDRRAEKPPVEQDRSGLERKRTIPSTQTGDSSRSSLSAQLGGLADPGSDAEWFGGGLYIEPGAERGGQGNLPFRTPEAPALPGRLEITRALRPLIGQVDDPAKSTFDEEATVRRIAETDIWIPVHRPSPRARFEAALVVDMSPSMTIWHRTVSELRTLLERHRAFADVQLWGLHVIGRTVTLRHGLGNDTGLPLSWPGPLRDSQRRRLVLLVSDCVGKPWQDGTMAEALSGLALHSHVVVVQVLPAHLWLRTGLGDAPMITVSAIGTSGRLQYKPVRDRFGDPLPHGPPISVTTLEPARLHAWARLASGDSKAHVPAFMLDPTPTTVHTLSERTAEQRVNVFVAGASPTARHLAGLLATASPLNLHVARLIQRTMLPESRQTHLAEVFLGGLLRRDPEADPRLPPDDVRYEFYEGVRPQLRNAVPIADSIAVLRKVSEYIGGQRGAGQDFFAFLDELLITTPVGDHQFQPFAAVAADVLSSLGGRYSELASRLSAVARRPLAQRSRQRQPAPSNQPKVQSSVIAPSPPSRPLFVDGRALTPLDQIEAVSPEIRRKLNAFWITTVEELVSTAQASNQQYNSGHAALAVALGMSNEDLTVIIKAASAYIPDDTSF